jgi:ketosteroid isomerase-like protein
MSQENMEAFKRAVDAFNRGDVEALLEVIDAEVEWHDVFAQMLGGEAMVYRGHEGVRELWGDLSGAFAELHVEYSEFRDLGDRIVAIGHLRVRGSESGARFPLHGCARSCCRSALPATRHKGCSRVAGTHDRTTLIAQHAVPPVAAARGEWPGRIGRVDAVESLKQGLGRCAESVVAQSVAHKRFRALDQPRPVRRNPRRSGGF